MLSRNELEEGSPVRPQRVLQVFVRLGRVLELSVGGQVLGTTAEHPFWVDGQGWVAAGELQVGDVLVSHTGELLKVEGLRDTDDVQTVYNLEVGEDHTYFVGCAEWGFSIWAHNAGCTPDDVLTAVKDVRPNTRLGKANARRVADAINAGDTATARAILQDRVKGVGPKRAGQIADVLVDKAKLYERPYHFRSGVREKVWYAAEKAGGGKVIDPGSKQVIKPGDAWDMGHKPYYEFRKHQESAKQRGITRDQFIDEHNNPAHYRPELPSSNRNHRGEILTDDYFGP